jgi:hypothetical protein
MSNSFILPPVLRSTTSTWPADSPKEELRNKILQDYNELLDWILDRTKPKKLYVLTTDDIYNNILRNKTKLVIISEIKNLLELNNRFEKYIENKRLFEDDSDTLKRIGDMEYIIKEDIIKKGIRMANSAIRTGIPPSGMKTNYYNKYLKYKNKYLELKKQ